MAKRPEKNSVGQPEKSEAEIMRDMNETLKRMHKTPPKPHKAKPQSNEQANNTRKGEKR